MKDWKINSILNTLLSTLLLLILIGSSLGCDRKQSERGINTEDVIELIQKHDKYSNNLDLKSLKKLYSKDFVLIIEEQSGDFIKLNKNESLKLFEAAPKLSNYKMSRSEVVVKNISNNKARLTSHVIGEQINNNQIEQTKSKEIFYIIRKNNKLEIYKVHSIAEN